MIALERYGDAVDRHEVEDESHQDDGSHHDVGRRMLANRADGLTEPLASDLAAHLRADGGPPLLYLDSVADLRRVSHAPSSLRQSRG